MDTPMPKSRDDSETSIGAVLETAKMAEDENVAAIVASVINVYTDAMRRMGTPRLLTYIDVQNIFGMVRLCLGGHPLERSLARIVRQTHGT